MDSSIGLSRQPQKLPRLLPSCGMQRVNLPPSSALSIEKNAGGISAGMVVEVGYGRSLCPSLRCPTGGYGMGGREGAVRQDWGGNVVVVLLLGLQRFSRLPISPATKALRMWNRAQHGLHLIICACSSQLIQQLLCLKGTHDQFNLPGGFRKFSGKMRLDKVEQTCTLDHMR
jgi:hypothetical protein